MLRFHTLLFTLASVAAAQSPDSSRRAAPLAAVTITATRTARSTFDTPQPVTVFDSARLAESHANGIADLFRGVAGLDASGVGPNQRRPEIRGQRGQRILLLGDGLRLNNSRRQQDFGELPAVLGFSSIERVEVVRGPSSVLYGTDAIGGVVNLISAGVPRALPSGDVRGAIRYRYGSVGSESTPDLSLMSRFGKLGVLVSAEYRDVSEYSAPSGSFGNVTLSQSAVVHGSGVRDHAAHVALTYDVTTTGALFARVDAYSARNAGFGFVDPSLLGTGQPKIQIQYPDQNYTRYTAGYRDRALSLVVADRVDVSAYVQRNERHLDQDIFIPITPTANVTTTSFNFTDLLTVGGRLEAAKGLGGSRVLTYGVDAFRDRSNNTDTSKTVVVGFGPTVTQASNKPSVPNASFTSAGVFAQLEFQPLARLTTVIGGRAQSISAETRVTTNLTAPLVSGTDRTAVWSANALYHVTSSVNAVASVGRGFRGPNLVERFFNGATPEGSAYQRANAALTAESSINVDLGLRARHGMWYGEGFVFRNTINDAIKAVATGKIVGGLPEYSNQNVARLRMDGLEMLAGARASTGWDGSLSYTRNIGRNISNPGSPIGDSYSTKVVGDVAYRRPGDRFMVGYSVRYQGEQKDVIIGPNPIGSVIPTFTVHSARTSVQLMDRGRMHNRLAVSVDNIGNRLYAEFPNASFFRPEPGRSLSVSLMNAF